METKICKCCGRELHISSFKKSRWGGYVSVCLDCDREHRSEKRQQRIDEQKRKLRIGEPKTASCVLLISHLVN